MSVRLVVVAVLLAGCTMPPARDPLDPARGAESGVGRPVLSLVWKRVIKDHGGDTRPQEFAAAAWSRPDSGKPNTQFVYVGSLGGELYKLEAERGEVVWHTEVGATSGRPMVDGDRVYLGTDDGQLIALDARTGEVKWRYATRGAVLHPPVPWGDLLIFANDADHVYAVERKTGKWRWQYDRETPEEFTVRGHGGVAIADDRVYVGFADGNVVALHASSGDVVWSRSLAGDQTQFVDVDSTPMLAGDTLYAASTAGGLYALDPADGAERWHADITGAGEVTLDGGRLYVAAADLGLYALDRSGHVLWRQGLLRAGDPAQPVIDGDYLMVSTSGAGLFVVDKRSGQLLESFNPGFGISSAPTLADGRLFVLSNGGVLYAMNVRRF